MEWYTWVLTIVGGVILGLLVSSRKPANKAIIHIVNEEDFKNNMRKGQLVDIRKKEEFENTKIKGARNFTKKSVLSKYSKIRKDQAVFIYCNNGKQSLSLAKKMSKESYKAIYVLDGGIENTK